MSILSIQAADKTFVVLAANFWNHFLLHAIVMKLFSVDFYPWLLGTVDPVLNFRYDRL